jgi:NAD dependent epimerase/dehydratase family enzyme
MNKPFWAPKVPRFILKLVLGEMSQIILNSQKVVSKEHAKINFDLKHGHINDAFNELF